MGFVGSWLGGRVLFLVFLHFGFFNKKFLRPGPVDECSALSSSSSSINDRLLFLFSWFFFSFLLRPPLVRSKKEQKRKKRAEATPFCVCFF